MSLPTQISQTEAFLFTRIQKEIIDLSQFLDMIPNTKGSGAIVIFCGRVRESTQEFVAEGKRSVSYLEYEAHHSLAKKSMREILQQCSREETLQFCGCIHRVGKVNLGQVAVAVITASAHRTGAYTASQKIITRIKTEVPLWKKEVYTDGSHEWSPQTKQN